MNIITCHYLIGKDPFNGGLRDVAFEEGFHERRPVQFQGILFPKVRNDGPWNTFTPISFYGFIAMSSQTRVETTDSTSTEKLY